MYQGMSGDCDFPKILEIFSQRLVFRIASWILVSDVSHLLQLMSSKIRLPQWCGWAVAAPSLSFIKMDRTTGLIKMLESLTSFMPQVPLNMKVCVCVGEFDLTSFIQFILYLNSIDFSCVHESSWFEFLETFWPHEMHTGQHPLPVCWAEGLAIRYRSP